MILAKIEDILQAKNLSISKTAIVNLLYTYGHISQKLNNALKPYDISLQQFNVLRILRGQNKNPVSLEMVQERMINKMSNTTRLINKLVKKGYAEKSINKANRRKVNIVITQKGLELLDEVDLVIDNKESSILQGLSQDETKEFIRLLGKIHG
ncbi:MarR family winged helix-turn-helix transcriptional regulator [Snuella lapsa]|uniref:MarR family transcriptional regulator n=1 Tax=Snuella lapsa TaxID=870481 RepID=A0ABP6WVN8_9FLAO